MSEEQLETGYDIPTPPMPDGTQVEQWRAMFVIGIDMKGVAHVAMTNVEEWLSTKVFEHEADPDEVWLACTQVQKDLNEISTAQRVMLNLHMMGAAMQQQAQAQQIAKATGMGHTGPPPGIITPKK